MWKMSVRLVNPFLVRPTDLISDLLGWSVGLVNTKFLRSIILVRPIMPDPSDFVNTFFYAGRFFREIFHKEKRTTKFFFCQVFLRSNL